jgi:plasmid stabilization system protein ParE
MVEKVIWSAMAREDLREIAAYIAQDRPSVAEDYCLRLIEFAETAGDFPRLGRIVPELEDENVREIVQPPYRIIYELFPNQPRPVIMRVWHGARGTPEPVRPLLP